MINKLPSFRSPALWIISLILLLAFLLRVIFLDQIPPGMANDEMNIIINAQSFLKTGQNIPGVVTGILGNPRGELEGGIHSEFSSYLLIPFILLTGFVWPWVKLAFVFASLGIIAVSYLLVRRLINPYAAMIAVFISALSPWTIFYGRSGYESILSSFFYLLGVYLVISLKKWRIFWALPFFIIGLGCYFSAKTMMLPIVIVAVVSLWIFNPKAAKIPGITLIVAAAVFMAIYLPILKNTPAGSRFGELSNHQISELVNVRRTASLDQPIAPVYENKIAEDLKYRLKASLGGFSLNYLFLDGQPENIPSLAIPDHGFLYLIDLPFILLGLFYMARTYPKVVFLLGGMLGVTLIPNALNLQGTTYSIRTVILFPTLTMISSIGIYYAVQFFRQKTFGLLTIAGITLIYLIFAGNFVFQYFGRLPVDRNEGWFLPQRTAVRYTSLMNSKLPETKITIVTQEVKPDFYRYLLFTNSYTDSALIKQINQKIEQRQYTANNTTVTGECPQIFNNAQVYLIDERVKCPVEGDREIASIKDAGTKFRIVNDQLCKEYPAQKYPHIINVSDLKIESLSAEEFCQKYITSNH